MRTWIAPHPEHPNKECRFAHYSGQLDLENTEPHNPDNIKRYNSIVRNRSKPYDWWGIQGGYKKGSQIMEIIQTGWKEGKDRATEEFGPKIKMPHMPSLQRRRVWGDQGDNLDMQRVYSGQVDRAWQRATRSRNGGIKTHILINVDIGGNCNRKPDEFFWRGSLAALVADRLILAGRSVKIMLGQHSHNWTNEGPNYLETNIVLKEFHQPMTLEQMVTACSLCGWFRTYGFKMILNTPETARSGLGYYQRYTGMGVSEAHPNVHRINITDIWDKETAAQQALEIAERINE